MEPSFLRDSLQGSQTLLLMLYDPAIRAPASDGDFLGIMSLGCVMQNLWLAAQNLGISMQILSALGATPVQRELRPILRIPETRSVAFACRLGFPMPPTAAPLRIRRELPDFVYRNRWGDSIRLTGDP